MDSKIGDRLALLYLAIFENELINMYQSIYGINTNKIRKYTGRERKRERKEKRTWRN